MTDKSSAAIREFAEKWCLRVIECMKDDDYIMHDPEGLLSDLTALISEHYVSREEYDEEKKSNSLLHKAMVTAEKGGHDKAMEEISEHYYPKEFVRWKDKKDLRYSSLHNRYYSDTDNGMREFTLDELFNYWEENEQC